MVDELVNDSRSSQLGQIHKDLHGVLIGKDDETFHRELLSTRAAPEQGEEEEEEVEVRVELLDLEDANDPSDEEEGDPGEEGGSDTKINSSKSPPWLKLNYQNLFIV
ncbi:hypothetical protein FOXG_18226 [Fusarium oxysporum f. sp. lycopersici 4287]|uniref:Uncharacterized protein n=1 Tax=Fusarium oxysporum f. sp. lycopersici (strain 4287 / CBS 123668 / FGSC 9935 / NRRL 34936) TaxID=426428 RepID=A0A0J9WHQ7_FUSO4|nr:hypothetical protein FOXG_18226 [Fusarium oxysporum f. sp. lycopersici 4287]KNA97201.1 hypothetical protein FOXG_18226 [Fusarium oxysporum f. sp. lycopersici 4287]